jgi:hypothetical protein
MKRGGKVRVDTFHPLHSAAGDGECPHRPIKNHALPNMIKKTFVLILAAGGLLTGCSKTPGDSFVHNQTEEAKAGNHWAEFKLWDAYANGANGVAPDAAQAGKWLNQFVQDVYVVRFEPAGGFHPKNAVDYLNNIRQHTPQVRSDSKRIGVSGFFRTTVVGDKLVASFLSNEPAQLQGFIEQNPDLKFVSSERMTAEKFIEYEQSQQQSL